MAYIVFGSGVFPLHNDVTLIGGRNSDIREFSSVDLQAFITNDLNRQFTIMNSSFEDIIKVDDIILTPGMFCNLCQDNRIHIPNLPSFRFSYLIPPTIRIELPRTSSSLLPAMTRQIGTDSDGNPIYPFIVYAAAAPVSVPSIDNGISLIENLIPSLTIDNMVPDNN